MAVEQSHFQLLVRWGVMLGLNRNPGNALALPCPRPRVLHNNSASPGGGYWGGLTPPPPFLSDWANHLEERLLDQAQARASYTPLFWGRSRSIPQCMVSNV